LKTIKKKVKFKIYVINKMKSPPPHPSPLRGRGGGKKGAEICVRIKLKDFQVLQNMFWMMS
jgi:hypothetical protein